jgi:hypothetical protein
MFDHPLLTIFVFLAVLFLYIHITAQWKTSEDLEIYEMDYLNNANLQEICAVKQPVLFELPHCVELYDRIQLSKMSKYDTYDLGVKDTRDYYRATDESSFPTAKGSSEPDFTSVESVSLPFHSAVRLMETDTNARYISESNAAFLEETGLANTVGGLDYYLKPTGNMYSQMDLWLGSKGATTPMRYHTNTNCFVVATGGKIRVKMTPWKSRKLLYPIKDYDQYEFRSPVNVWTPAEIHKHEIDKLRCLDFDVHAGYVLSIPPYWWYSIQYSTDPATCVCAVSYNTIINSLAHINDWAMYYLQQSNITTKVSKPPKSESREDDDNIVPNTASATPPPPNEPKEIITNAGVYHVAPSE